MIIGHFYYTNQDQTHIAMKIAARRHKQKTPHRGGVFVYSSMT
jgi:hypothetical protein